MEIGILLVVIFILGVIAFLAFGPMSLFNLRARSAKDTFVINNINTSGGQTFIDYTNIAYLNKSQSFTLINNFTNFTQASDLNISGILFVGENRSAFPLNCAGNDFLSGLGSNGIFVCTV